MTNASDFTGKMLVRITLTKVSYHLIHYIFEKRFLTLFIYRIVKTTLRQNMIYLETLT